MNSEALLLFSTIGTGGATLYTFKVYWENRAKKNGMVNLIGPIFWGVLFLISLALLIGG